jgi:hypothetical protein
MGIRLLATVSLLAAALLLPGVAFAQQAATPAKPAAAAPVAPAGSQPYVGVLPQSAISKFNTMAPAERDQVIKQAAQKIQHMTPAERQAFFESNRKAVAAMTPAQKNEMQARIKAASDAYIAAHKAEWAKNNAAEQKIEDARDRQFLALMPGIERAVLEKYREARKTHGREYAWHMILEDAQKGGKLKPLPE